MFNFPIRSTGLNPSMNSSIAITLKIGEEVRRDSNTAGISFAIGSWHRGSTSKSDPNVAVIVELLCNCFRRATSKDEISFAKLEESNFSLTVNCRWKWCPIICYRIIQVWQTTGTHNQYFVIFQCETCRMVNGCRWRNWLCFPYLCFRIICLEIKWINQQERVLPQSNTSIDLYRDWIGWP